MSYNLPPFIKNFSADYLKYFNEATLIDGSSDPTDAFFTLLQSGINKKLGSSDMLKFIGSRTATINLVDTMTDVDIQAYIDAVSKFIPTDHSMTFQFANGTYNSLEQALAWRGFFGGGVVRIYGNTVETNANIKHTSQDVVLDFKGYNVNGIFMVANTCPMYVYNLRVEVDDEMEPCYFNQCPGGNRAWYNHFVVNGVTNGGYGLLADTSAIVEARSNYFTGGYTSIYSATNSNVYSNDNDDITVQPVYGLRAAANGVIGKNSTQPTGTTANELTAPGGEIR